MQAESSRDPLGGVRVIDFSSIMAGPYCTRILCDQGAEVIKVEEPPGGDMLRARAPLRDGVSAYFGHLNAGKKSIVLNLKRPAAVDLAKRLIQSADVVVEAFRPGVMRRFGLDYEAVAKDNPRLIYCSISGYGQEGPGASKPAYAPIVHAASGYELANMRYTGGTRPLPSGFFFADIMCGIHAAGAITSALYHRERGGTGQHVDVSLMDTMINSMVYEIQEAQFPVEKPRLVYGALRTADGFILITPITQRNFEAMADTMGHSEWKTDTRFATGSARERNWGELMALAEAWTSERPGVFCEEQMNEAGCACTMYRSVRELMNDPQLSARQSFAEICDSAGAYFVPNLPYKFSSARVAVRRHVPAVGEHTCEILQRILNVPSFQLEDVQRQIES